MIELPRIETPREQRLAELGRDLLSAAGTNRVAFLRFAAEPGQVHSDRAKASPLDGKGTNIAASLEVASAAIPPSYVPHVVLLSDGNQTLGDALKAALRGGAGIDRPHRHSA